MFLEQEECEILQQAVSNVAVMGINTSHLLVKLI
jgi:hypothetical protein